MTKVSGALKVSPNFLNIKATPFGASIFGFPSQTLGRIKTKIHDNICDSTPEVDKALSPASYSPKNMKPDSDNSKSNNIFNDIGYTGIGDKKRKRFLTHLHERLLKVKVES